MSPIGNGVQEAPAGSVSLNGGWYIPGMGFEPPGTTSVVTGQPRGFINGIEVPVTQVVPTTGAQPVAPPEPGAGDIVAEQPGVGLGGLAMLPLILGGLAGGAGVLAAGGGTQQIVGGIATGALAAPSTFGAVPIAGVGGIPISGPGVPEPPAALVARQWRIMVRAEDIGNYWVYFFKLIDKRIMSYNPRKQEWKIWRPKKHIVISSDPRMSMVRKLERTYNKVIRSLARKSRALKLEKGWGGR